SDGLVLQQTNQAAASGILREWQGHPLELFASNFSDCSIMRAEMTAAEMGFKIAWDIGFRKIHLQLDSQAADAAINI
ncbi:hypothetical protein LINPERPRIM_LOCUS30672, partial [Linum perenne]